MWDKGYKSHPCGSKYENKRKPTYQAHIKRKEKFFHLPMVISVSNVMTDKNFCLQLQGKNCWTNTGSRSSITFSWQVIADVILCFFTARVEAARNSAAPVMLFFDKKMIGFFSRYHYEYVLLLRGWPALNKLTTYRYCTGVGQKKDNITDGSACCIHALFQVVIWFQSSLANFTAL
jgi:hypothetical protein